MEIKNKTIDYTYLILGNMIWLIYLAMFFRHGADFTNVSVLGLFWAVSCSGFSLLLYLCDSSNLEEYDDKVKKYNSFKFIICIFLIVMIIGFSIVYVLA